MATIPMGQQQHMQVNHARRE